MINVFIVTFYYMSNTVLCAGYIIEALFSWNIQFIEVIGVYIIKEQITEVCSGFSERQQGAVTA